MASFLYYLFWQEKKGQNDSVGGEAGSHLGAREEEEEEEEEEARDDYVTGNDVIIRELNSVVEKLEREKSHLQGKD